MKTRVSVLIVACFAFCAIAAGFCSAQDGKIGFVDIQKLASKSEKFKAKQMKMQDSVKTKTETLEKLRTDIARLREDIEKKGPMLNEEKRIDMLKQMKYKEVDYQVAEQQAQSFVQNEGREAEAMFLQELRDVVVSLKKQLGLKMVFSTAGVLAADDSLDITDEVAKAYDAAATTGTAPRPAKPAAPAAPPKSTTPAPKR
jgi:Skp family chaperone for outer membrane proteins